VLKGSIQSGKLSVELDSKARTYRVETSAYIGPIGTKAGSDNSGASSPPDESSTAPRVKSAAHIERAGESGPANSTEGDQKDAPSDAAKVMLSSEPGGAEIYVDGVFMGNTPSMVQLSAGPYGVRIESKGHETWSRTISLTSGSKVTVQATLDPEQ
jgi:hypothetical protein